MSSKLKVSTLGQAIAAIARQHRNARFEAPHKARLVERAWEGIRRGHGAAPRRVDPVTLELLRQLSAALPSSLLGIRDRALLVLGFCAARRRAELVALDVQDVTLRPNGLIVHVRRSKTDQFGAGLRVGVRAGESELTCPVRTLSAWLQAASLTHGPLFVGVNRHGQLGGRLTPAAVAKVVKRTAVAAGLDPAQLGGHSLRAGLTTTALAAGKREDRIMQHVGWGSRDTLDIYARTVALLDDDNPTANIGL